MVRKEWNVMNANPQKRVAALIAAFALIAASAAPSLAAETDGLEAAILLAKSLVDVPAEMGEFDYHISEDEALGYATYSLNWNDKDGGGAVNAEVANGRLVSLYRYAKDDGERKGLGGVSREDARKTAEAFLAAVDAGLAAKMEPIETSPSANADRHVFGFVMKENGIPADFVTARVGVDKHPGVIADYSWNGVADPPVLPADARAAISEAAAKAAFLAEDGVRLEYRSWYDRESKKRSVKLVYALKDASLAIDAETGERINLSRGIAPRNAAYGMVQEASSDAGAPQLTEAEISALDALGGLLTKEEARAAVLRIFPEAQGMDTDGASIRRDYTDESRYIWSLNLVRKVQTNAGASAEGDAWAGAQLDAKTGELLSWSYYDNAQRKGVRADASRDRALAAARAFVEKNVRAEKRARLAEDESVSDSYAEKPDGRVFDYAVRFDRYENGVIFKGNGVEVGVDAETGRVTRYNQSWFENIDIPDIPGERGVGKERDAAFDLYDNKSDFGLKYAKLYEDGDPKGKIVLAWHWNAADGVDYLIDAVSFEVLGTDGKPYRGAFTAAYGDIAGHWAESTINALIENGYYIEGDNFEPNARITQEVFLRYLYAPEQRYYDTSDDFYGMLADRGVVKDDERDADAPLTRQDAAKFAVRHLGLQRIAEHPEAFAVPFGDGPDAEYRGYAAVVKALSIMRGDAAGNFGGARVLTRAEAAAVIFNMLDAR
ncbi:MAG: S-layer homology domain-containing protein [Clostridiales Family XIII bacterium]|jgi:hypothetical protein|nr:S-layer homology domain-containing protein [Clostridiales Family XIII bacterium]